MSNLKLLSKILRLTGMKITGFVFKNRGKELHLAVKPYKNGCCCPECGRRGRIVHHTSQARLWEGSHTPGHEDPALVCAQGDSLPDARAGAGDDPLGTGLLAHHLPPGVAHLHSVPDHDPEGCRRDLEDGPLDVPMPRSSSTAFMS